jgi:hypothetical protein
MVTGKGFLCWQTGLAGAHLGLSDEFIENVAFSADNNSLKGKCRNRLLQTLGLEELARGSL